MTRHRLGLTGQDINCCETSGRAIKRMPAYISTRHGSKTPVSHFDCKLGSKTSFMAGHRTYIQCPNTAHFNTVIPPCGLCRRARLTTLNPRRTKRSLSVSERGEGGAIVYTYTYTMMGRKEVVRASTVSTERTGSGNVQQTGDGGGSPFAVSGTDPNNRQGGLRHAD